MSLETRRLSERHTLERPLEANLICCGEAVSGWIVDEQDDGLGMAFGGDDVGRVQAFRERCPDGRVQLWLGDDEVRGRAIPVRLVHVTPPDGERACRAGLAFDVAHMAAEDIAHLMVIWRRLMSS